MLQSHRARIETCKDRRAGFHNSRVRFTVVGFEAKSCTKSCCPVAGCEAFPSELSDSLDGITPKGISAGRATEKHMRESLAAPRPTAKLKLNGSV